MRDEGSKLGVTNLLEWMRTMYQLIDMYVLIDYYIKEEKANPHEITNQTRLLVVVDC